MPIGIWHGVVRRRSHASSGIPESPARLRQRPSPGDLGWPRVIALALSERVRHQAVASGLMRCGVASYLGLAGMRTCRGTTPFSRAAQATRTTTRPSFTSRMSATSTPIGIEMSMANGCRRHRDESRWEVICAECGDNEGPSEDQNPVIQQFRGPYPSEHKALHVAHAHERKSNPELRWLPGSTGFPQPGGLL